MPQQDDRNQIPPPAYLIVDTESVPDGRLVAGVKYPGENLPPEEAVRRAQEEARAKNGSDFLPVSFQIPVAACALRVAADFTLQSIKCLDAPQFRPRKIVEAFWMGVDRYKSKSRNLKLVTFNGRGFDMPLLELCAFRYGLGNREHFTGDRKRFDGWHFDLLEWLTNYGAYRLVGGLNVLSKILGNPGKMTVTGEMVYPMFLEGKLQEINDYCLCDTLDTYFVFLRTRVMCGELDLEREHVAVMKAKEWIQAKSVEMPGLKTYLENWGDWNPWP